MTDQSETRPLLLSSSTLTSSQGRSGGGDPLDDASLKAKEVPFSEIERAVLKALLFDPLKSTTNDTERVLTIEMLLSVPACLDENRSAGQRGKPQEPQHRHDYHQPLSKTHPNPRQAGQAKRPSVMKKPMDYRLQVGLWQAHEDGVSPKRLIRMSSVNSSSEDLAKAMAELEKEGLARAIDTGYPDEGDNLIGDADSMRSENEVRDDLSQISWKENEGGFSHFDAWQILKDEYASDFGFDYKPDGRYVSETELSYNTFKIIGTSADDKSAHPHVLSPPLMDSLMNFLPDYLQGQNYWMKYSLIRDGASLDTFRNYARASKDTILAIETTRGEVFGVYTSSPWKTNPTFFGGAPSFAWRMRQSRMTPCHSLIEQAQMESEIDVFFLLDKAARIQTCTHNRIGVGVGNMNKYDAEGLILQTELEAEEENGKNFGFVIALEDDLLSGTTSQSPSYKNPCLCDPSSHGEAFQVLNVELWSLTPAFSEESAERLEMTQYLVSESVRNSFHNSVRSSARTSSRSYTSSDGVGFSSRDLTQEKFYHKIGDHDDHQELREKWQNGWVTN